MSGLDLLRARVVFRDRSVSDVCDLALRFGAENRLVYAKVGAVTLLPLAGIALAFGAIAGWPLSWLAAIPLAVAAELPFTVLASRLVFEDRVRARDVVLESVRRAPAVLLGRLAMAAFSALGLALFFVPGVWLALTSIHVPEVMLLERAGLSTAYGRAQRIASVETSDSVLALAVLFALPIASVLGLDFGGRALLGEVLQFRPPASVWTAGGSALAVAALFLQAPYRATARFFVYLNVRTRAEGWDIQTRFAGIAARATEEA